MYMAQAMLSSLCSSGCHQTPGYLSALPAENGILKHAPPYSSSAENVYDLKNASASVILVDCTV